MFYVSYILRFTEIQMKSPSISPLQGASRTTGGIFRGRALGNVFNFADADVEDKEGPVMGKVRIYTEHVIPTQVSPFTSVTVKVTRQLGLILKKVATRYRSMSGKFSFK